MSTSDDTSARSRAILNVIRLMGYQVKVNHDENRTEVQATQVAEPHLSYVSRSSDGSVADREYRAACGLARALKLDPDEF